MDLYTTAHPHCSKYPFRNAKVLPHVKTKGPICAGVSLEVQPSHLYSCALPPLNGPSSCITSHWTVRLGNLFFLFYFTQKQEIHSVLAPQLKWQLLFDMADNIKQCCEGEKSLGFLRPIYCSNSSDFVCWEPCDRRNPNAIGSRGPYIDVKPPDPAVSNKHHS